MLVRLLELAVRPPRAALQRLEPVSRSSGGHGTGPRGPEESRARCTSWALKAGPSAQPWTETWAAGPRATGSWCQPHGHGRRGHPCPRLQAASTDPALVQTSGSRWCEVQAGGREAAGGAGPQGTVLARSQHPTPFTPAEAGGWVRGTMQGETEPYQKEGEGSRRGRASLLYRSDSCLRSVRTAPAGQEVVGAGSRQLQDNSPPCLAEPACSPGRPTCRRSQYPGVWSLLIPTESGSCEGAGETPLVREGASPRTPTPGPGGQVRGAGLVLGQADGTSSAALRDEELLSALKKPRTWAAVAGAS